GNGPRPSGTDPCRLSKGRPGGSTSNGPSSTTRISPCSGTPAAPSRTASWCCGSTCARPTPSSRAVDAEVEALYGLPLDEFTRARDALAKERTRAGDKAAAADVKALRKPSLTAWALNQ